jgi:hypothetical protein
LARVARRAVAAGGPSLLVPALSLAFVGLIQAAGISASFGTLDSLEADLPMMRRRAGSKPVDLKVK